MKKLIFTIALLIASVASFAQKTAVDDIINHFKGKENVQLIDLPKAMIGMAMGKVDDADVKAILSNINHVRVITMDDCSKKVRKNFAEDVTKLNGNGYEEMVRANDNGDKALIMTKMKGDDITEVLILDDEPDECNFVQILGTIKKQDIDKLVNMTGNKK
jgi:hypothetical protein